LKFEHIENYFILAGYIRKQSPTINFMSMEPKQSVIANYDDHMITLFNHTFSHGSQFTGKITGPRYSFNIDFTVHIVNGLPENNRTGASFRGKMSNGHHQMINQIVICVVDPNMVDPDEFEAFVVMPDVVLLEGFGFENLDTCIFKSDVPVKGVHDG